MRNTILFSISILLFISSCKKHKYNTVPSLKFESVNKTVVKYGDILEMKLSFTDKEGDLEDSIYVEKFEPKCVDSRFSQWRKLPAFPTTKNQFGEIVVSYGYRVPGYPFQSIKEPQCGRNDTCIFKFVLKDKEQNKSDTAYSGTIVIVK